MNTYYVVFSALFLSMYIFCFFRNILDFRQGARPFLKAVAARLKRIDTSVLNDKELLKKLTETLNNG